MLNIDTEKMLIELTRGDTASIVFSAVDKEGNTYEPSEGDSLQFAVAKKVGSEPIGSVRTVFDGVDTDAFWTIVIGDPFWYEKDEEGNITDPPVDLFKFKDYVWDVQLTTSSGVDTIIGETSDLHPMFRVLGEVATE